MSQLFLKTPKASIVDDPFPSPRIKLLTPDEEEVEAPQVETKEEMEVRIRAKILAELLELTGEKYEGCFGCLTPKPIRLIVEGVCDTCRNKPEPVESAEIQPDWPEVRQRRNTLIADSDYTQLPDIDPDVAVLFVKWRQQLRDVTNLPTPGEAWSRIIELQENRPDSK